jgi:hypothetical protein
MRTVKRSGKNYDERILPRQQQNVSRWKRAVGKSAIGKWQLAISDWPTQGRIADIRGQPHGKPGQTGQVAVIARRRPHRRIPE